MSTIYVSNEYLQRAARIRNHLNTYRKEFLSLSYIDGSGMYSQSCYDIWVNLCLLTSKIRPAFMVQSIDYMDPDTYDTILKLLKNYRDDLSPEDIDYRLLFITNPQGIIVTTYYTFYKGGLRNLYQQYVGNILLGKILGYPAAGEDEPKSGDIEYLERGEQPPGRYTYSIYAITPGSNPSQIMVNIYRTSESRKKLNDLTVLIKETMKIYDPQCIISVDDTQNLTEVSKDNSLLQQAEVSEDQRQKYKEFINDPRRKQENWNDEFDRVFEMGYMYYQTMN